MFLSKSELKPAATADDEGAEAGGEEALEESQDQAVTPVPTRPTQIITVLAQKRQNFSVRASLSMRAVTCCCIRESSASSPRRRRRTEPAGRGGGAGGC